MSSTRSLERSTHVRGGKRTLLDGCDLVAEVHSRSLRELEQLARAERARVLGDLIARAVRALASVAAGILREPKLRPAADALTYRTRRNSGRPLA